MHSPAHDGDSAHECSFRVRLSGTAKIVANEEERVMPQAKGFRQVGYRERLGQMHGVWRDVVLLERRSQVVGV